MPISRLAEIVRGRRSDSSLRFLASAASARHRTRSLDFNVLRRGFAAVADDFILDLLAFIERAQASALHRRDMNEYVLRAALGLNETVAFGRVDPLHRSGRHQESPSSELVSQPQAAPSGRLLQQLLRPAWPQTVAPKRYAFGAGSGNFI